MTIIPSGKFLFFLMEIDVLGDGCGPLSSPSNTEHCVYVMLLSPICHPLTVQ